MRMWNVNTKIMCRKHLLGEHVELHMLVGSIRKKKSVDGYVKNNLIELKKIKSRHGELVEEMERRGYTHKSPLPSFSLSIFNKDIIEAEVDVELSLKELITRCPECRGNYNLINL